MNLVGKPLKKSFPIDEKDKESDETIGNVILSILSVYETKNRKEVFYVNHVAQKVLASKDGQIELPEPYLTFLKEAVYEGTVREDKNGQTKGLYYAYMIAQVLEELGEEDITKK